MLDTTEFTAQTLAEQARLKKRQSELSEIIDANDKVIRPYWTEMQSIREQMDMVDRYLILVGAFKYE